MVIRPNERLHAIAPDFLGLGYEISSVARPGLLTSRNRVYVQLVRTLSARGVIRIGGNTSDYSVYSPTAAPVSSAKGTVVNDAVLHDLGGFLSATGWRLIWGLNLGRGSIPDAIAEAHAVLAAAGRQLLAFEIGNEPNWGLHKRLIGEVDVFQVDSTHELYGHMNVNYLRLSDVPSFDHWADALAALAKGDYFTTTGFPCGWRKSYGAMATIPTARSFRWRAPGSSAKVSSLGRPERGIGDAGHAGGSERIHHCRPGHPGGNGSPTVHHAGRDRRHRAVGP